VSPKDSEIPPARTVSLSPSAQTIPFCQVFPGNFEERQTSKTQGRKAAWVVGGMPNGMGMVAGGRRRGVRANRELCRPRNRSRSSIYPIADIRPADRDVEGARRVGIGNPVERSRERVPPSGRMSVCAPLDDIDQGRMGGCVRRYYETRWSLREVATLKVGQLATCCFT
jgi:hypothetical protein